MAMGKKKLAVFILTLSFIIGLVIVDEAYSDMMGKVGVLSLQTRRVDQDWVTFSLLGKEYKVNMTDMQSKWDYLFEQEEERAKDLPFPFTTL
ncbi:MAG: hypothetical protein PHE41_06475 [Eubacteriales bacterium]|nr:hypothetical protein [Eubacteriales bacterium]